MSHVPLAILLATFLTLVVVELSADAQKGQNLAVGACNKEAPSFCDRIVRNSVCNRAKNECFCRKGFVAVKEGDSVACKTLLTDLKCRVDADCVHVNRSSCHPGAGFCTCPGNTVFVPQLNACRTKLFERKSLVCSSCLKEGGSCFAYDANDRQPDSASTFEPYGCVCPNFRTSTQFRHPSRPQRTCGAQLVDIGELCNNEDLQCRSPLAVCNPLDEQTWSRKGYQNGPSYGICSCLPNNIPVFQKLLRYFECYPKAGIKEETCQQCIKNGGECYWLTNTRAECKCPLGKSNSQIYGNVNNGVCTFKHVQTICENGLLLICYVPHWEAPYEDLASHLGSGAAEARLTAASLGSADSACRLRRATDVTSSLTDLWRAMLTKLSSHSPRAGNATRVGPYCTQLDIAHDLPLHCGIRIYSVAVKLYILTSREILKVQSEAIKNKYVTQALGFFAQTLSKTMLEKLADVTRLCGRGLP
uniref:ZP domain-containing protein n=1 Tax=Mesocestoides corti TaxID=53468 RepID=A0A5K3FIZ5_MESCO